MAGGSDSGEDGAGHAKVPRVCLLVIAGPDMGATYLSSGERTVIGTYDGADLVLKDSTVSRFHCEIVAAGAGRTARITLRDLGSLNGTSINGVGVVAAQLAGGATITMGRTQLRFDVGDTALDVPLSPRSRFGRLLGSSVAMRRAFALLERAAAGDGTVLLEGERGTGKRLAAESIHAASGRARGPFVVVPCGALTGDLLESELFGHEQGALEGAGALPPRAGAFEAAHGGTLFLEDVGDLPLELQPRLLRALERREVKRAGAARPQNVDVRVIAGTCRSLRADVNAKKLRSDLFYRLAALEVPLPPLRARAGDVELLVTAMLETRGAARPPAVLSPGFIDELARQRWPGNLDELRARLERSLDLSPEPLPPLAVARAAAAADKETWAWQTAST